MLQSIIAGVISGVISSALIYVTMFKVKPKVNISKQICKDCKDGLFRVKIVNLTHVTLVDIKYTLHRCHRHSDGIVDITEISPNKSRIEFLEEYSKKDQDSDYATRISFPFVGEDFENSGDYLQIDFYAKHPTSGTAVFLKKIYRKEDIVCGRFETGTSTKILVETCNKQRFACVGAKERA